MGEFDNVVAVVTGAARGQGRSHAVALAEQGADIIAVDICADLEAIPYALGTEAELAETVQLVGSTGRKAVPVIADVRDLAGLRAGVQAGIDELGEVDVVIANAGVVAIGVTEPDAEPVFNTIVDTNLKGVWHTMLATVPSIVRKGVGGSVVLVSSSQGLTGRGGDGSAAMFAYAASKHGVVGLMRSAANAYAPHKIRVNSVHPSGVATPMILNDFVVNRMTENPNPAVSQMLLPGVPLVEARDVTEAVLWLAGPRSRYVTGVSIPVDAGHVVM
ncbi:MULTISPECIES: mycofactocin-coupled SDR family oxidoreductase [Mycobacterium]|uniref:(-)-trans-carveol dehydrogenase n=1 Tax=Mycobacterium intracellulare 1956 TaxID=1299331 RepID=X8CKE1_MYCIT|nr:MULTISPECIES: mycofactocin-coupled SDR family oxidoreductase [Mycobacterium]EUA55720.1 (-)-trans-carveol dehydrogenase [Mycobacterium intracellulare 1956]ASW86634.1 SDR family mycofactocin-dependent oxidoreductase [Mycobacterium intracellulare]EUA31686.1 (-)-trans-carveol dehydrogenase [Mycobacterium intracellulare]UQB91142.1 mycofactocin-coupled SDR family oxidoreductase [Mycobacterium intracellulare]WSE48171.1 mycofactocin-coupled SDR family oxidoreductase [Mycobacterium sp. 3-98]